VRAFGLDVVTDLCAGLVDQGAPGLHFYTLNTAASRRRSGKGSDSRHPEGHVGAMPNSKEFFAHVQEMMQPAGRASVRAMFGGWLLCLSLMGQSPRRRLRRPPRQRV
jgi:hypothetical protein